MTEAGSKAKLEEKVGHTIEHFNLDRRFEYNDQTGRYVILVETKQNFVDEDEKQLVSSGNPDWEWVDDYIKSLPYSDKINAID